MRIKAKKDSGPGRPIGFPEAGFEVENPDDIPHEELRGHVWHAMATIAREPVKPDVARIEVRRSGDGDVAIRYFGRAGRAEEKDEVEHHVPGKE